MNDDFDNLDSLLQQHLRAELDPHIGKTAEAFTKTVKPLSRRWMIWAVGSIGAMAASIGIVWSMSRHVAPTPKTHPSPQYVDSTRPTETWPVSQVEQQRNIDEGTVVFDGVGPARRVRQQIVETTTYYDPAGDGRLEVTVPTEGVTYVALQPH